MNQKTGKTCIVTTKSVIDKHIWRRYKEVRHSTPGSQLWLTARDLRKDHREELNGSMELYSKFSLGHLFWALLAWTQAQQAAPSMPTGKEKLTESQWPLRNTNMHLTKGPHSWTAESSPVSKHLHEKLYINRKWNCKLTSKQCRIILVTLC